MTDISDIYTSKYLKADDLQGRDVTVVIDRFEVVKLDDGPKLCIYFRGKERGLLLNKINATNIASLYGSKAEGWVGKSITIGSSWVDFQGKSVKAIRVRPEVPGTYAPQDYQAPPPSRPTAPQPQPTRTQQWDDLGHPDLDDSVPF